jgi:organic hydroperoxide reductase OsmC/OhrA
MKPLPHHYSVSIGADGGDLELSSNGLQPLRSAPPAEFGGPGDLWSPETLFLGAVADCFVLTFKAIASGAKLRWRNIHCDAEGTLERAEDAVRFTDILLRVRLEISREMDPERAQRLLEKAEKGCLVGNSLRFHPRLECDVVFEEAPTLAA